MRYVGSSILPLGTNLKFKIKDDSINYIWNYSNSNYMGSIKKLKYYEGDYVKLIGEDTIYRVIGPYDSWFVVKYNNKNTNVNTSFENIRPIPITQEFLYKNSYSVYNTPDYNQYALNEIYAIKEVNNKFYFNGIELIYVHELQHLIDLLKIDKELEI